MAESINVAGEVDCGGGLGEGICDPVGMPPLSILDDSGTIGFTKRSLTGRPNDRVRDWLITWEVGHKGVDGVPMTRFDGTVWPQT